MSTAAPTLTDLQRIELAFPAIALLHVLDHGADAAQPRVRHVRGLFVATVDEVMRGLTLSQDRRLRSRLHRTLRVFLSPLVRAGGRVDVVGLVAWRVLEAVLDDGVLVLPEGTPLSDALGAMRPGLERALNDSNIAVEVARTWPSALHRLQATGLYTEVGRRGATVA